MRGPALTALGEALLLEKRQLRQYSLTKMLRSRGVHRSPAGKCACGKTISTNKDACFVCSQKETAAA